MRLEEDDINKIQPEAELLMSGMQEFLFKEAHEQVGVEGGSKKVFQAERLWGWGMLCTGKVAMMVLG